MILFFDTETTGLPKNWKAPVTDLDNWPRLVQLAYLVYDFDDNLIHSCNEIVKPNGFTIPVDASNIHGITTDIANQRGSNIEEVFELFSIHLKRAKVLVAHNMAYDEKIIGSEMIRLGMENTVDSKEKICTMESTIDLCKIEGPYGYKWPKLEELHQFLFKHNFEGAHDALADIQATAKCFWELVRNNSIQFESLSSMNENKKHFISNRSIEDEIRFSIKNKKRIKIKYRNFNEIISERTLSNVEFSDNVLTKEDLELFQIDSNYITAFCSLRNEKRTFKITRIIEAEIILDSTSQKDNSSIKIPLLIPCSRNGVKKIINSETLEAVLFEKENYEKVKFYNFFNDNTLLLEKDEKVTFFDKNSNYKDLEWFDEIKKLDENFAIVTANSKKRIYNLKSPIKKNDYWFDRIDVRTKIADYQFYINYDLNSQKAIVRNFGKWGLINFNNEILLDVKFDSIRLLDNEIILISRVGKWGLMNLNDLTWILDLSYEEFVSYTFPLLVLKNNNICILYNILTLSVVFDAFASISFADEYYVLVDFENKYGIFDPNRNYISGCKWESISDYDGKYIYFEDNNKKGCFNTTNEIQIGEPVFCDFSRFLAGYSKVEINRKWCFLSEKGVLEEVSLPRYNGALINDFGPLTVFQINEEDRTVFKIYTGNKLAKNINFKRSDNSRGKSTVQIGLRKSIQDNEICFCIEERVEWNWDKYGTPRFYPRQFFSLSEDKVEQSVYYSGSDLNKNSWKITNLFVKKEADKLQYNNYLTPLEDTNWKIEDNSKNDNPTRIFFKGELFYEFHAEEVKFGPFINGITELDVCYWADHEGYAGQHFGYVDIHGKSYFDYEFDSKEDSNVNDITNDDDDLLPF
jgi:DNA polymerase-3 subunit epsilon